MDGWAREYMHYQVLIYQLLRCLLNGSKSAKWLLSNHSEAAIYALFKTITMSKNYSVSDSDFYSNSVSDSNSDSDSNSVYFLHSVFALF